MWKFKADSTTTSAGKLSMCTETINTDASGTFLVDGYYTTTGLTTGGLTTGVTTVGAT